MSQWGMMLMLAVVCSSFGFAMQPVAQRTISSETAGLMTAINPLTTAVLGAVVLHEPFGILSIIGAVLIIAAIIIHNLIAEKS
jgi:drug/metabolite transporter (DMT)-like permease